MSNKVLFRSLGSLLVLFLLVGCLPEKTAKNSESSGDTQSELAITNSSESSSKPNPEAPQPVAADPNMCSVDEDSLEFKFTGYKFTEKAGVSGTFKKIQVGTYESTDKLEDALKSVKLLISTDSIDAGKAARNINIKKALFKNLTGGDTITASIHALDMKKKTARAKIVIGDKTDVVDLKMENNGGIFTFTGELDLLKMTSSEYKKAFRALAKLCSALHRGKDGKSVTWSTVDIVVSGKMMGNCN